MTNMDMTEYETGTLTCGHDFKYICYNIASKYNAWATKATTLFRHWSIETNLLLFFSISVRNDEWILHDFCQCLLWKGKSYFRSLPAVWHVWEVAIATYWSGVHVLESKNALRKKIWIDNTELESLHHHLIHQRFCCNYLVYTPIKPQPVCHIMSLLSFYANKISLIRQSDKSMIFFIFKDCYHSH